MLLPFFALFLNSVTAAPEAPSLLATVPESAYILVHCNDIAAVRSRAERNDWYRLLGTEQGEPFMSELARDIQAETHSDLDELLALANELEGEIVFFDAGNVAGFATAPPANSDQLVHLAQDWLPSGTSSARPIIDVGAATVELAAWPDEIDGWNGRAGHFAAFVNHPEMIAIYSGDARDDVMAVVSECVARLEPKANAPLVSAYLENGGGKSSGVEVFIDFTPLVDDAEAELARAVEGILPDPTDLLGLEHGTWLHVQADVFPGRQVECTATLRIPPETLAARLADTFRPLPHALAASLPSGVWGIYALHWDVKQFYQRARASVEEAGRGEGLESLDAGREVARGLADVDPIVDVLNQLAGDFVAYMVEPPDLEITELTEDERVFSMLGFYAGLVDGSAFHTAMEKLFEAGALENYFDVQELAGVDAYLIADDSTLDGGIAFMPHAFSVALSKRVLERGLKALSRSDGASLLDGSSMHATIDANSGACFLVCIEMTPLRKFLMAGSPQDLLLPPLEDGSPARDPFDSMLVGSARRTRTGFEFSLATR